MRMPIVPELTIKITKKVDGLITDHAYQGKVGFKVIDGVVVIHEGKEYLVPHDCYVILKKNFGVPNE